MDGRIHFIKELNGQKHSIASAIQASQYGLNQLFKPKDKRDKEI